MKRSVFAIMIAVMLVVCAAMGVLAFAQAESAGPEPERVTVTELTPQNGGLTFTGTWEFPEAASTCTLGNKVSYTGVFTQITWYGLANHDMGTSIVRIDGAEIARVRPFRDVYEDNQVVWRSDILERGEHTLEIELTSINGDGTPGGWLSVTRLVATDDRHPVIKRIYDDSNADFTYSGFGANFDQPGLYEGTVHSSNLNGATAELTVEDVRRFVLYTDRGWARGIIEVYIDGVRSETVDLYDGVNVAGSFVMYVSPELTQGSHTIKVVSTATKSANAVDVWVTVDRIDAYLWEEPTVLYDFDDTCFGYDGDWLFFGGESAAYYLRSVHSTQAAGDTMTAVFSSVRGIRLYASKAPDRRSADIYLNGEYAATVDERSAEYVPSGMLWSSGKLQTGDYELKIVVRGGAGNDWFEIDKIQTDGINGDNMIIHGENNSFIAYSRGVEKVEEQNAAFGTAHKIPTGESMSVNCRGSFADLAFLDGDGAVNIYVDGKLKFAAEVSQVSNLVHVALADKTKFVNIRVECTEGTVLFDSLTTDDESLQSFLGYMYTRADAEIEERVNGTRVVSDPSAWQPVAFAAEKPTSGVSLSGGVLSGIFDKAVKYFSDSIGKPSYVDNVEWWVSTLKGSNEGRMLAGLSNALNWTENARFESELDKILKTIRARQVANGNGYCLDYPESMLAGVSDGAVDERRNYDRAMFVKGLIAAGNYYHNKGVAIKDNLAYTILREFTDWFNYNSNKYGEHMLEGVLGLQGHPASTYTYFTPVGKTEDMTYAELCYIQDWWIESLAAEIPESIWRYPLNRSHCYITTGIDSYLDHYRATGDEKYLNACVGYWNMMHEFYVHTGGALAICEFDNYYPGSYFLDGAHHTGELCGSAFWIDFNYKLLRLFPNEEKYAREVEDGIYNIMRAAQDENGKIRYHARYNDSLTEALNTNTCCEVNGATLMARLPEYIYLLESTGVRVNLYDGSALDVTVGGKHFALTQTANILDGDVSVIKITGDDMDLVLRVPSWAKSFSVKINGAAYDGEVPTCGYVTLAVKTGDTVEATAVKELEAVDYNGYTQVENKTRHAFTYGPVLMAVVAEPDAHYEHKFTVHGMTEQKNDEYAIDLNMSLAEFTAGLVPLGGGKWRYEKDGAAPFTVMPYGELTSGTMFSVYPLFGYTEAAPRPPVETVDGETLTIKFGGDPSLDGWEVYSSSNMYGVIFENGALVTSAFAEQKIMPGGRYDNGLISVRLDLTAKRVGDINAGIYFNASKPSNAQDKINALNLQAESDGNGVRLALYLFDAESGYMGAVAIGATTIVLSPNVRIELVVKNKTVYGYINGTLSLEYAPEESLGYGGIGIRSQFSGIGISEFSVTNSAVVLPEPKESYSVVVMNGDDKLLDKTYEKGDAIAFVPPHIDGYAFEGLYSDKELTELATMPETAEANVTLYAKYVKTVTETPPPGGDGSTQAPPSDGLPTAACVAIACVVEAVVFALAVLAYVLIRKKKGQKQ